VVDGLHSRCPSAAFAEIRQFLGVSFEHHGKGDHQNTLHVDATPDFFASHKKS